MTKDPGESYIELKKKYPKNNLKLCEMLNGDAKDNPTLSSVLIDDPALSQPIFLRYATMLASMSEDGKAVLLTFQNNLDLETVYAIYLTNDNCIRKGTLTRSYIFDEITGTTITYKKTMSEGQDSRGRYLPNT